MAQPTTAKGTKLRLLLEDTPGGGAFTIFCGLNAKGINFQTNTNDTFVPDCDNPDDPAWREVTKSGRFASISGSGTLDTKNALSRYRAAYDSADAVNMQVELAIAAGDGGGHWEGAFQLTQMNITGNDGELVQANITLESSGEVAWVAA